MFEDYPSNTSAGGYANGGTLGMTYTVPKPQMFDLATYLYAQKIWSERTFGPGDRRMGVIKHIRKELNEVKKAEDGSTDLLMEWVDILILAFDGARRSGFSPEMIIQGLVLKDLINQKTKAWPDWRKMGKDEPIEHIRNK